MTTQKISDERRAAIAIFLSILVVFTWTNLFQTPTPVAPTKTEVTNVPAAPSAAPQDVVITTKPLADSTAEVPLAEVAKPTVVTDQDYLSASYLQIDSPLYVARVSLLGGKLLSFRLKKYKTSATGDELVELVKTTGKNLPLGITSNTLTDATSLYVVNGVSAGFIEGQKEFKLIGSEDLSFSLVGSLADGTSVTKNFKFRADSYLFDVNYELSAAPKDGSVMQLAWSTYLPASFFSDRYNRKSVFSQSDSGGVTRHYLDGKPVSYQGVSNWVGMGDSYFMTSLVSPATKRNLTQQVEQTADQGVLITLKLAGDPQKGDFQIYAGPKDPKILEAAGFDLYKAIDLGWFSFIGQPILALIEICFSLLGNYGLAIILVTILIKLLLLPLTKKSFLSMQAMQKIQPQIVALRERIKDPAVVQQEMLKIYQQNGVNPLGGCLPMLLQMPVFLGMYNALQSSISLRHAEFALWINDLSTPESLMIAGIPIPVMILLMGGSMFLQTMTTPTTADPNQKKIMYMMPVMFTLMFIIYPFPSGLVLYWLVNNIMSIIQQYALRTERNIQPFKATIVSGVIVFGIGYLLTLI